MTPPDGDVVADAAWYVRWFGEDYLHLYPHRDEQEAIEGVDLVLDHLEPAYGSTALDLACGAGRHVEGLTRRGLTAFGLDLSLPLLLRATARDGCFVRGDMRSLPFADDTFDLVTNFFTSFGYFPARAEDARVVDEVRRVLRPGGGFAFDFLNADLVRRTLRSRDERSVNQRRVIQERRLLEEGRIVEKRIEIHGDGPPRIYHERVRLYDVEELEEILEDHGLRVTAHFGDYQGVAPTPETPRVILLGRAR